MENQGAARAMAQGFVPTGLVGSRLGFQWVLNHGPGPEKAHSRRHKIVETTLSFAVLDRALIPCLRWRRIWEWEQAKFQTWLEWSWGSLCKPSVSWPGPG